MPVSSKATSDFSLRILSWRIAVLGASLDTAGRASTGSATADP
jgi:hypothetical protein